MARTAPEAGRAIRIYQKENVMAENKPRAPKGHVTIDGKQYRKVELKEGGIVCPLTSRRIRRTDQTRIGTLYEGKTTTCPLCGREDTPIRFGRPYVNDWSWGKHDRADQYVEGGKVVGEPWKRTEPGKVFNADPGF